MTWYMVAVAAIEAAGTATAALLPTGPGDLVSDGLLVGVIACYGGALLPTWLVAATAQVPRAPGVPRVPRAPQVPRVPRGPQVPRAHPVIRPAPQPGAALTPADPGRVPRWGA